MEGFQEREGTSRPCSVAAHPGGEGPHVSPESRWPAPSRMERMPAHTREQWVRERGMGLSEPPLPEGKPHRMELGTGPEVTPGLVQLRELQHLGEGAARAWLELGQPQPQREEGPCAAGQRRLGFRRVSLLGLGSPDPRRGNCGLRPEKPALLHAHCCWGRWVPEECSF